MRLRFVLASASPARLATLRAAGVEPEVIVSDVDESRVHADAPAELVGLLAAAKAEAVAARVPDALVLGCDSLLDLDGTALGKPGSAAAAVQRWHEMRGRQGVLRTGHCLIDGPTGRRVERTVSTAVSFAEAGDAEIQAYANSGEPAAVAGAFTLDGLGGWLVESVHGDPHNVVGLSLPTLRHMLAEIGYALADLGWPGT